MRAEPGAHFCRAKTDVALSWRTRDGCKRLRETEASVNLSTPQPRWGWTSVRYVPICFSPGSQSSRAAATLGFRPQPHSGLILESAFCLLLKRLLKSLERGVDQLARDHERRFDANHFRF